MSVKHAVLIFCGIASICNGLPYSENNARNVRQTAAQAMHENRLRHRFSNYPTSSLYQTHTIDFPGTTGPRSDHHQSFGSFALNSIPLSITHPTTIRTTSTTKLPSTFIIGDVERNQEESPAPIPIPSVRAPIEPSRNVGTRRQHIARPKPIRHETIEQRFENTDSATDVHKKVHVETEEERLLHEEQAKNAHYSFGTSIDDTINDHAIARQETRDGLALKGMYSYSDGFFMRTIHYEADENGYRVVKEEIEPIGNGPQFNPEGKADITANLHNNHLSYSITAKDFVRDNHNKTDAIGQTI